MNPAHDQPADDTPDMMAVIEELAAQTYVTVMRHEPPLRSFQRALTDLALPIPADWASFADEDTVTFSPMRAKQFRLLINALERLVALVPEPAAEVPNPNQGVLFEAVTVDFSKRENNTSNAARKEQPPADADEGPASSGPTDVE